MAWRAIDAKSFLATLQQSKRHGRRRGRLVIELDDIVWLCCRTDVRGIGLLLRLVDHVIAADQQQQTERKDAVSFHSAGISSMRRGWYFSRTSPAWNTCSASSLSTATIHRSRIARRIDSQLSIGSYSRGIRLIMK